ncbi:MAG: iron-sulfur cluster assembly accessory protein [Bacteroidetes bacterium]|nr:MAG: iron-sulfur cluster assembly accessory protein [Bacteroidota bacterium]
MLLKPVSITTTAIAAIKEIMSSKEIPDDYGLRIGLENMGASCGSTQYVLGFDKKADNDLAYEVDEVPVYIKKSEVLHVTGLKLDHITKGEVSGFSFEKEDN